MLDISRDLTLKPVQVGWKAAHVQKRPEDAGRTSNNRGISMR